ncbi:MAG: hypothetical protein FWF02_11480 [Micrococcales bacterium]|nr:hypothetical protein [Micrococcales bacterium]MCL2668307.1 hypothetical protein [Micrococcales bacterium]
MSGQNDTVTEVDSRRYGTDFFDILGKLKRAAIDAYMASKNFEHNGGLYRRERLSPNKDRRIMVYVTMPDDLGRGGGTSDEKTLPGWGEDYVTDFTDVRVRINCIVERWMNLPEPDTIEEVAKNFSEIAERLRMDDGSPASISAEIKTVEDKFGSGFDGIAMDAFTGKFINMLRIVLQHHYALAGLLSNSMCSQVGIWTAARAGFVQIVESTTASFNKMAKWSGGDLRVTLRVLQYALSIADIKSPKDAIEMAIRFGLNVLGRDGDSTDRTDSEPLSGKPATFEECMMAFEQHLSALARQVWGAENNVRTSVNSNMGEIENDKDRYELSGWSLDTASLAGKTATAVGLDNYTKIEGIADRDMVAIHDALHSLVEGPAGAAAQDEPIAQTVSRDISIGLGQCGPADAVREFNEVLKDLMRNLVRDLEQGRADLWAAYEYLNNANDQSAAKLNEIAATIDQGGDLDPWDYETPPADLRATMNFLYAMGGYSPSRQVPMVCTTDGRELKVDWLEQRDQTKDEQ